MRSLRRAQGRRWTRTACLAVVALALSVTSRAQEAKPPADPPQGFGAVSKGGEGGRAITVTTLNDNGPGSLRAALTARGPRVVRFAVEGTIEL